MSRTSSPTISHRLQYGVFRAFEGVLRLMSLETTFKAGEFLGRILHRLLPSRRNQVIKNLTYAFGDEKSEEEIEALAASIFERTGANFLSSMRIPFLSDEEVVHHVSFEGLEEFMIEAQKGGLIIVSPHMGNWELLAQSVFLTGGKIKVGTHYRPLNNQLINAVIERRRKRRGLQLFSKHTSVHRITNFVKNGGILNILADQRVGSRGTPGTFFGRPTTCSPLPHIIAKRANVRIMSLVCGTVGPAKWKITFQEVPEISAQACASSLEAAWRRSPEDVFWFEDRWRIQGNDPLKFLEKYGPQHGISRPLRLVNLTEHPGLLPYSQELITQENAHLDFSMSDQELSNALKKIDALGPISPDVFICPQAHRAKLRKLSRKTQVITFESLI